MATKTISITEDAYERLKERKKGNESFSDVIYKITSKRSLFEIAGILSKNESGKMEKEIKKLRNPSDEKVKAISKLFEK